MREPVETADGVQDEAPVEQMSYTDASAELDGIVGFFEQREVDVDQLVERLVRATAIIEELDKRLRRTRVQVEQLLPRLGSVLDEVASADAPTADAPTAGGATADARSDDATPDDETAVDATLDDPVPSGERPVDVRQHNSRDARRGSDEQGLF